MSGTKDPQTGRFLPADKLAVAFQKDDGAKAVDVLLKATREDFAAQEAQPDQTPPAANGIPADQIRDLLASLVPGLVEQEVQKRLLAEKAAEAARVDALLNPAPLVFKKTYRCDTTPVLMIQKFDFLRANAEGVPHTQHPVLGEMIVFANGVLRTNDDNEIAQIEWMMANPSTVGTGVNERVVGGNPSVYEDDGARVHHCRLCDYVTASKNAFEAHMRATHRA